jgi:hypothetical protein
VIYKWEYVGIYEGILSQLTTIAAVKKGGWYNGIFWLPHITRAITQKFLAQAVHRRPTMGLIKELLEPDNSLGE